MKQIMIAMALITSTATFSQEKKSSPVKPTAAAEAAFKKAFPSAGNVKWSSEDKDFEVNFKQSKKEMSAVFTPAGELKETEEEISVSALPAATTLYIKQHYKTAIREAMKITDGQGNITYEVEVGEAEVFFSKDGKFIKEEKEGAEEKD